MIFGLTKHLIVTVVDCSDKKPYKCSKRDFIFLLQFFSGNNIPFRREPLLHVPEHYSLQKQTVMLSSPTDFLLGSTACFSERDPL